MNGSSAVMKLHDRVPTAVPEDQGPMVDAAFVAREIWEGRYSAKWVGQVMGPAIGFKLGKPWLFYENEARAWKAKYITDKKRRANGTNR